MRRTFVQTSIGNGIIGAKNDDTSEASDEDEHKNSFFGESRKSFEMDRLETVPFDNEVGDDYQSDYTV
jgi:hypothetical protein